MKENESESHIRLCDPDGLECTRLLCPRDFPGKNPGVVTAIYFSRYQTHVPCISRQIFFTTEPPGKTKVFGRVNLKSSHHTQIHTRVCEVLEVLTNLLVVTIPQYMQKSGHHFVHFRLTQPCISFQFSSAAQSCLTLCHPMNCSTPGLPVHHQLPDLAQTHVHWVGDATQPSHPLSSPSLLPSIFASIRVFSNELVLHIR